MSAMETFVATWGFDRQTPSVSTRANRLQLCNLFRDMGYRRGAEIGVWTGEFSAAICAANPGVQLMCVDPWTAYKNYNEKKNDQGRLDDAYRQAVERLQPFGCEIVRATSRDAAARVPDGSLDFVYIDANHARAFVQADLNAWAPKVRAGGIVSGHDYLMHGKKNMAWIDVKVAVDAFTQARQIAPWYVVAAEKAPSFFWVVA